MILHGATWPRTPEQVLDRHIQPDLAVLPPSDRDHEGTGEIGRVRGTAASSRDWEICVIKFVL